MLDTLERGFVIMFHIAEFCLDIMELMFYMFVFIVLLPVILFIFGTALFFGAMAKLVKNETM